MQNTQTKTLVKKINIELIRPYWRNARKNEEAVKVVKKSIEDYGYNQLIAVDKDNVIIVGHTRYKALLELGYKEIDVMVVDLPEEKAREYRIVDNKTSEFATWDTGALIDEIRSLGGVEGLQTYFKDIDIGALVREVKATAMKDVSVDDIMKANQRAQTVFTQNNQDEVAEYIDLACPICGEQFSLKRNEVLSEASYLKERAENGVETKKMEGEK